MFLFRNQLTVYTTGQGRVDTVAHHSKLIIIITGCVIMCACCLLSVSPETIWTNLFVVPGPCECVHSFVGRYAESRYVLHAAAVLNSANLPSAGGYIAGIPLTSARLYSWPVWYPRRLSENWSFIVRSQLRCCVQRQLKILEEHIADPFEIRYGGFKLLLFRLFYSCNIAIT